MTDNKLLWVMSEVMDKKLELMNNDIRAAIRAIGRKFLFILADTSSEVKNKKNSKEWED